MRKYIIEWGHLECATIEAPSLFLARRAAIIAAFKDGYLLPEELQDCRAMEWTWHRARDRDLLQGEPLWIEHMREGV